MRMQGEVASVAQVHLMRLFGKIQLFGRPKEEDFNTLLWDKDVTLEDLQAFIDKERELLRLTKEELAEEDDVETLFVKLTHDELPAVVRLSRLIKSKDILKPRYHDELDDLYDLLQDAKKTLQALCPSLDKVTADAIRVEKEIDAQNRVHFHALAQHAHLIKLLDKEEEDTLTHCTQARSFGKSCSAQLERLSSFCNAVSQGKSYPSDDDLDENYAIVHSLVRDLEKLQREMKRFRRIHKRVSRTIAGILAHSKRLSEVSEEIRKRRKNNAA